MADYIYLLQNRLNSAQQKALEAVRDAARQRGMPVFLVGGAVRDLSSGAPVRDLDFAVQGDPAALVGDLTDRGAIIAGQHPKFASTYFVFPGGVRAELSATIAVTYPKPGQPEAQPAAILDDLKHRDFTANAMAISLNEGSFGLLLDPLNGIADLENRELRLVSNYGFIEQPVLILRAARLGHRLGWNLEERTQARYETAKEENYLSGLDAWGKGYELEEIFHEEDPLSVAEHLAAEGWSDLLLQGWDSGKADRDNLERVRDLQGQMEQMGIATDPSPVVFPVLTAKLNPDELTALKSSFARPGFAEQIDSIEARGKELASQLSAKSSSAPSDTWKLLFAAEPELVLYLAHSVRTGVVHTKLKAFLNDWPQMRQRVPYALMQEMRITPDLPGYAELLDDIFFASLDGKLATPEATRAFLEPYSPPAPTPQAAPRRKPAKAARSRGKKGAAPVEVADADPEDTSDSSDEEKDASTEKDAPAVPKVTSSAKAASAKSSAAGSAETAAKSVPAKKPASVHVIEKATPAASLGNAAKVATPGKTQGGATAKSDAVPAKVAKVAPKVQAEAAPPATKAASPAAKKAVAEKPAAAPAKASPVKEVPSAKAAPPAKAQPAKAAPVKATAAKSAAPATKTASKAAPSSTKPAVAKSSSAPSKAVAKKVKGR